MAVDKDEFEMDELQWKEYEEVKKRFDEFKNFKKITNKRDSIIVRKEDIIEGIKKTKIAEKYDQKDIYQWMHSYNPSKRFYEK